MGREKWKDATWQPSTLGGAPAVPSPDRDSLAPDTSLVGLWNAEFLFPKASSPGLSLGNIPLSQLRTRVTALLACKPQNSCS